VKSLKGVNCVECLARGHCCQAEIFEDEKPLCMRCANDEPCCFETAKQAPCLPRFEERETGLLAGTRISERARMPRTVVHIMPTTSWQERCEIVLELKTLPLQEVAERHQFEPWVIELIAQGEGESREELERRKRAELRWQREQMRERLLNEKRAERKRIMQVEIDRRHVKSIASVEALQLIVAEHFGLTRDALICTARTRSLMPPRHVGMYLAAEWLGATTMEIATAFGGRDHATVIYGIRRARKIIENDQAIREWVATTYQQIIADEIAA
jgi:chromosomal replication initiation ATPase DnaA